MSSRRKRAVSLRLESAELARIKQIAGRLGANDSEVIRYAIRNLLLTLSPLTDPQIRGKALVPLFLEGGESLLAHFALDARRLDAIINGPVGGTAEPPEPVSLEDLHLIAMGSGMDAGSPAAVAPRSGERRASPSRRYLYDKYLYRAADRR